MWDYFHYSTLVRTVRRIGANDTEMESWVQYYMKDLKSFFLVTEVEEFIDADLITDDLPPAKRAKYDGH